MARKHGSGQQRDRSKSDFFTLMVNDTLLKLLFHITFFLDSTDLGILGLKVCMLPPGDNGSIKLEADSASGHYRYLMLLNKSSKKGVPVITGVLFTSYQEK